MNSEIDIIKIKSLLNKMMKFIKVDLLDRLDGKDSFDPNVGWKELLEYAREIRILSNYVDAESSILINNMVDATQDNLNSMLVFGMENNHKIYFGDEYKNFFYEQMNIKFQKVQTDLDDFAVKINKSLVEGTSINREPLSNTTNVYGNNIANSGAGYVNLSGNVTASGNNIITIDSSVIDEKIKEITEEHAATMAEIKASVAKLEEEIANNSAVKSGIIQRTEALDAILKTAQRFSDFTLTTLAALAK